MPRWHLRSKKKPTGGRLNSNMKRNSRQKGSKFLDTKIGKINVKLKRMRGGKDKSKILSAESINVTTKGAPSKMAKIVSVEHNTANLHYVRRNTLTKGAIVKTDIGNVKITSRPGQSGFLNGVLVEDKK